MISIKQPQQQMVVGVGGGGGGNGNRPVVRKQTGPTTGGKLMRLRCRFRPLHDTYLQNDDITEKESDVVFLCLDGRVRAHKIILASASQFYASLFEGQLPGMMTNVLVPDIPVSYVRIILSLAYKDTVTLSPQQMKDVEKYLKLFGFPSKLFTFDGNPLRSGNSGTRTVPVNMPINAGVGVSGGKVRVVNQQGQIVNKQPSLSIGSSNKTATGPSGAITVTASSIYRDIKAAQQRQQLAAAAQRQRVEAAEAAEESEYKFQLQGYEQQQQAMLPPKTIQQGQQRIVNPQIRKTLTGELLRQPAGGQSQAQPKRVFPTSPLRRIAPKPTPGAPTVVETFTSPSGQDLQVQMETEEQGDEDEPIDSEHGRLLIQEWMRNVGRDDNSQTFTTRLSADGSEGPVKNQCMICNNIFDNEEKWRWHETHHVGLGLFKCAYCDELFSTSRKVYQHEMMEHGVTSGVGATDSPAIPSDFKIVQGRKRRVIDDEYEVVQSNQMMEPGGDEDPPKMTLVRTIHGSHYRRLPGTAGPIVSRTKKFLAAASGSPQLQQKYAKYATLARNFKARNPLIGIAKTDAEDLMESRKVKQLHWLYVCSKCENSTDSSAKAQTHYNKCYPDKEGSTFESSVVKYRQGFFGKYKCPLCPKRYTSIGGFTIHCGHMHNEYRRKFAHRHEDDTICCMICKKKYKDPSEFQAHLSDDGDCTGTPMFSPDDMISSEWIGNGTPGEESSAPPKISRINLGTLSRSTRLANRILTTAQDEASFNPVDCPICGASQIAKIVDHLQNDHTDLNIQVLRVADTTLRCQKCSISFALCDLLAHHGSCTGSKEFQFGGRGRSRAAGPAVPMPIPSGVGCSPIDTIECSDLSSLDTLRSALKCNVCQRTASKLGTIAECYRTHGIVRCALCFNTYVDKSSYSVHLKATHAGLVANKLRCPLCDKEFTNVGQTAGHMYNNHWITLLGTGQIARKGPRKFLPNLIDLDQLGDASAAASSSSAMIAGEGEEDSLQDDLGAEEADASAEGVHASDDYSNITLGSLLESSVANGGKSPASSSKVTAKVIVDDDGDKADGEENSGLEDLLNESDSKKSTANSSASADADPEGVMEEEDQETEDDELAPDGKLTDEFSEANDEVEDEEEDEVAEEEEDDETGMEINEDDDGIEIFPGADEEDEGEEDDIDSTTK